MTNDQKNAIKDAAKKAWNEGTYWDAVLAGIEKYDELACKDFDSFVSNFIRSITPQKEIKPPEPPQNNENVALFIPAGETDKKFIRVFDSPSEMFQKLAADFKSHIAISDNGDASIDIDWPNPHFLYTIYLDENKITHIGDYIGICDFQSFKKG